MADFRRDFGVAAVSINTILLFVAGLVSAGLGFKATFDRGFAAQ
jgi:hypothetical protein